MAEVCLAESSENRALGLNLGPTCLLRFRHLTPAKVHIPCESRAVLQVEPTTYTGLSARARGLRRVTRSPPHADRTPVCPSSLTLSSNLQTTDALRYFPPTGPVLSASSSPKAALPPRPFPQEWPCCPTSCSGQSWGIILHLPWAPTSNPPTSPVPQRVRQPMVSATHKGVNLSKLINLSLCLSFLIYRMWISRLPMALVISSHV